MNNLLENKNLSPMMRQYIETKEQYNDCLIFFRVGDFYELFFDDAINTSKELDIALTGKDCGLEEKAPMCGVPFHAVDIYISKLTQNGHKVAIVEQMEDPQTTKGLVKREVIKVVTPGTVLYNNALNEAKNNFLFSIYYDANGYGVSMIDYSVGSFTISNIRNMNNLIDLIDKFTPKEIIVNNLIYMSSLNIDNIKEKYNISFSVLDNDFFDEIHIKQNEYLYKLIHNIDNYENVKNTNCYYSLIMAYEYIRRSQKQDPTNIEKIEYFDMLEYMTIDNSTIRNLELLETLNGKERVGSLLNVLDYTKTAMGKRTLRNWIIEPLKIKNEILKRQDAIKNLYDDTSSMNTLTDYLFEIYDIERLSTRIIMKSANPKDLLQLKNSLKVLPEIKNIISNFKGELFEDIINNFDSLKDIYELIDSSIKEDAPLHIREGNIIKDGFNEDVDKYRESKTNGKNWLVELETKEREKTNIKNLKIKHSKLFGYLFEITNVYKGEVPSYFVRRQTLANAERYITEELSELQNTIMNAEERLKALEYELFMKIVDFIIENKERLNKVSKIISTIDTINSLATCAVKRNYHRPNINENGIINIKNGRHPVVETLNNNDEFIPNDTNLDDNKYIDIITGPNMAGKSTYMRQVALIALLTHMGSFVPADSCDMMLIDRIFTRVGASDDLSRGKSTFMVEMSEVANILKNATDKSLVILDEIGRGTSTYDGLSIAWAIVEYISEKIKSKTLFATHYHELTELEGKIKGVTNYNIAILEKDDDIIFLRKIVEGFAKKSYGIAVAHLAGIDEKVTKRANVILKKLIKQDEVNKIEKEDNIYNESYVDNDENKQNIEILKNNNDNKNNENKKYEMIKDFIKSIDMNNITPLEAMNVLNKIKQNTDEI